MMLGIKETQLQIKKRNATKEKKLGCKVKKKIHANKNATTVVDYQGCQVPL